MFDRGPLKSLESPGARNETLGTRKTVQVNFVSICQTDVTSFSRSVFLLLLWLGLVGFRVSFKVSFMVRLVFWLGKGLFEISG